MPSTSLLSGLISKCMDKKERTATKLAILSLAMFGFGYAMVPLYKIVCDITGINGKTGTISAQEISNLSVDNSRILTVEFDATVNSELPWKFAPVERKLMVRPGEVSEAIFIAENTTGMPITGRAIPSVAPTQASRFFNKSECFCFTLQTLEAYERKEMRVRFVVDRNIPKKISTLTLSYTFFLAPESKEIAMQNSSSGSIGI